MSTDLRCDECGVLDGMKRHARSFVSAEVGECECGHLALCRGCEDRAVFASRNSFCDLCDKGPTWDPPEPEHHSDCICADHSPEPYEEP